MNDKIATAFLMALAGALVVGILYIFFAPIPEEIGAVNPKEAERIRTTIECIKQSYRKALKRHKLRIQRYNHKRLQEWTHWTRLFIPSCTWYGESGTGPEYAPYRYTMANSGGSGAYGKFQMMSGTYHNRAKYHDWSALDQEIAARREYWANGTSPWSNC